MATTADQPERPDTESDGDRLSSLPDEILTHILSFLNTRLAVRTAVLSRRWKDRWTRVSNLDLDSYTSRKFDLCGILERVLGEHKIVSLKRFRLRLSGNSVLSQKFWSRMMELVAASQLEEIDVGLRFPSSLPDSFFYTLNNLKVVKLDGVMMMTASVFLPSLKILQLCRVYNFDCKSLSSFISGCPVLETAHLEECYYFPDLSGKHGTLTASLPSLKSLTIIGQRSLDSLSCPVAIEAPSLEHLELRNFGELEIVGNCPLWRLESVRLDISDESEISEDSLVVLFTRISNAKQMWLSSKTLIVLSRVVKDVRLPVFPNLIHLTIEAGGSWCPLLHSLLNSASKLQTLVIHLESDRGRMMVWEEDAEPAFTPECLLSSLEQIEIHDLLTVNEREMVAYLLNAGAVLKNVNMHLLYDIVGKEDRRVLASLLEKPRGSSACEARYFYCNVEIHIDSNDETYRIDDDDSKDGSEVRGKYVER